ncbi:MAG TPA: amidase [Gaiellaceae bacterium]|nr:amidase [Gaiellaceae bacterium]
MDELAFLTATEQAELVRRGEVTPVELVETCLERIERLNPELNAFVTVCGEEALAAAAGELPDGPFRGVPIPIKDLQETAGIRTTFSSRAYADYVPDFDVAVVRRLKGAGFVVIGKTNTPELGITAVTESQLNGVCRNPWDTSRTPGGSSGGAAVAVAAGLAPAAHGTDGGGSIRIPASCCGVFGLKPARGRVSLAPYGGHEGFSTSGPLVRGVLDAAALLDVIGGYETGDPWWLAPPERPYVAEVGAEPGRLRIALTTTPPIDAAVAPACVAAAEDAAALLRELGHEVEEATPPWADGRLLDLFMTVWKVIPGMRGKPRELFEPMNRVLMDAGDEIGAVDYVNATQELRAWARRVVAFWDEWDLVLTPTLAQPPPPVGALMDEADPWGNFDRAWRFTPFTQVANVTGLPAVSLPLYWSEDGLPIGAQLVGRPADEATLLRVSAQLEAARPWRDRRPPVS